MKTLKASLLPLCVFSLAAFARADDLLAARQMMAQAFSHLAVMDTVTINLAGDVRVTGYRERKTFAVQMVVVRKIVNNQERIYFEGLESEQSSKTRRYVGDGDHLWVYDAKRNTYSVVDYGSGQTPAERGGKLFNSLKRVTSGPAQFVAGLLADIDRSRTAGYDVVASTWTPYFSLATVETSLMSIACNTRPPQDTHLTYGFQLDKNNSQWFTSAACDSSAVIKGRRTTTAWSASFSEVAPELTDFTFSPGNATPVSITLSQGGG